MKTKTFAPQESGFTLVELLIGTAIVLFMVGMLGQILSSTQAMWRSSESRTDPFRDSRAALEMMSRQLSLATMNIPSTDTKAPVLALENVYSQPTDPDGPLHNQQVYLLGPIANSSKSDMCAVGFYCSWNSTKHAYVLRRHFMDSDATFNQLTTKAGLPAAAGPISANQIFVPTNPGANPNQDEDLAAYVWDLKVVPYDYKTGPLAANPTYPLEYKGTLPQFIEISFKAMSPQAANKLTAQGITTKVWFDTLGTVYKNQILPQLHQFDTRVRIYNGTGP